jgi:hypothetical protein
MQNHSKDNRQKIAPNTILMKEPSGEIFVTFYMTEILRFYVDGKVKINTDGYATKTTMKRINNILKDNGFDSTTIFQKSYVLYVTHNNETKKFHDGIIV